MNFFLGNRPDFSAASPEDVAMWVEQQFVQLAESLQQPAGSLDLYERSTVPDRYGDGTICNFSFDASSALAPPGYTTKGLYVFRAATQQWHRLVEE
jgi:hypothetical protein